MNWKDISYLEYGGRKQKRAYTALMRLEIFQALAPFHPVLVGTIPIGIDTDDSDLDIICRVINPEPFIRTINKRYSNCRKFKFYQREIRGISSIVAGFIFEDFFIEIFGQPLPVEEQYAYRHMIIEYRILKAAGPVFKEKIIALKESGIKTEPAFAQCLKLNGDPYEALLTLENLSTEELNEFLHTSLAPCEQGRLDD